MALSLLPTLIKDLLGGTRRRRRRCALVVFTVGIAVGSVVAARASHAPPNLALVPIGAFLMGLFCLDLALVACGDRRRHPLRSARCAR